MIKAIFFDIDGVLIRIPRRYSRVLKDLGYVNAPESLDKFYLNDLPCTTGHKDPLTEVKKYLAEFGWNKSAKEYFDEQFEYESRHLDIDLLNKVSLLRNNGIRCFLATDQNHFRKRFLLHDLGFERIFDGWFVSSEIGHVKISPDYWQKAIAKFKSEYVGIENSEILFVDDRNENTKVAASFGINVFHAPTEESIIELKALIKSEIEKRRNRTIASTL